MDTGNPTTTQNGDDHGQRIALLRPRSRRGAELKAGLAALRAIDPAVLVDDDDDTAADDMQAPMISLKVGEADPKNPIDGEGQRMAVYSNGPTTEGGGRAEKASVSHI